MDESLNSEVGEERLVSASGFFIIDLRTWDAACRLGLNEAISFLVLARGTQSDNRTTSWSKNAIQNCTGMAFGRAQQAIKRLCEEGFVRQVKAGSRPQYVLSAWLDIATRIEEKRRNALSEWDRLALETIERSGWPARASKSLRNSAGRLYQLGLLRPLGNGFEKVFDEGKDKQDDNIVWLPNTLVSGTSEVEDSPVKRLRRIGDVWTLQLVVQLYHAHNLRDDFGIERRFLYQEFERKKLGQHGLYTIWGFKPGDRTLVWDGPFSAHRQRTGPKDQDHVVWGDLSRLRQLGLLTFVPHLCESASKDAEIIHPYGIDANSKAGSIESSEYAIGQAANEAAEAMGFEHSINSVAADGCLLAPVHTNDFPNVQMVGIARLTYRPHTVKTSAWWTEHTELTPKWIELYTGLKAKAERNQAPSEFRAKVANAI